VPPASVPRHRIRGSHGRGRTSRCPTATTPSSPTHRSGMTCRPAAAATETATRTAVPRYWPAKTCQDRSRGVVVADGAPSTGQDEQQGHDDEVVHVRRGKHAHGRRDRSDEVSHPLAAYGSAAAKMTMAERAAGTVVGDNGRRESTARDRPPRFHGSIGHLRRLRSFAPIQTGSAWSRSVPGGGNVELLATQALELGVEVVGVARSSVAQDLQLAFTRWPNSAAGRPATSDCRRSSPARTP